MLLPARLLVCGSDCRGYLSCIVLFLIFSAIGTAAIIAAIHLNRPRATRPQPPSFCNTYRQPAQLITSLSVINMFGCHERWTGSNGHLHIYEFSSSSAYVGRGAREGLTAPARRAQGHMLMFLVLPKFNVGVASALKTFSARFVYV